MTKLLIFLAGLLTGLLMTGIYTQSDAAPVWRLNRITGEQRVCSAFTGKPTCMTVRGEDAR